VTVTKTASTARRGRGGGGLPASVWLRSLALQGSWNPQRLQNLGLLVALLPWLRARRAPLAERRRFCLRHYEFFNTNPYLAGFVIGGLLRLESETDPDDRPGRRRIAAYKTSLTQAFASLGDQLFWLGLRPAVLLAACLAAWTGDWRWPLAICALFAVLQLEGRRRAVRTGYRLGLEIVELLGRPAWHRAIATAKRVALLLTGALAGAHLARGAALAGRPEAVALGGTFLLGTGLALLLRRRIPPEGILALAAPLALALAWL
jgi:mannose/fructose/N-acetylgalactosamine-specific phosphotransferase system component IID